MLLPAFTGSDPIIQLTKFTVPAEQAANARQGPPRGLTPGQRSRQRTDAGTDSGTLGADDHIVVTGHNLAINVARDMAKVGVRRLFFAEPIRHAATHPVLDFSSAY